MVRIRNENLHKQEIQKINIINLVSEISEVLTHLKI